MPGMETSPCPNIRRPRRSHPSAGTHVPRHVTTMPSGTRTSGALGFQLALDLAGTYLFAAASLSPAREPGRFALLLCTHAHPDLGRRDDDSTLRLRSEFRYSFR